ncbi:zinc finger homeobox protein 4 [Tachyglossus aculeatus]|uniref:zinc finger homeobox protein 4 n=1 Tax=Tachyglossus aculeatus TaxID=9261 RepID=UPI0018F6FD56|nr:zinc finger homeobox protein 4 [Tachyglossus aculeatus]
METCDSSPISRQENGPRSATKPRGPAPQEGEGADKAAGPEADGGRASPAGAPRTDEGPGPGPPAGRGPAPAAARIPCHECAASFSSLQKYMEHHCPNARLPVLKEDRESESSEPEDSDVENLSGEIVYQPDGSAYIIEGARDGGPGAAAEAERPPAPAPAPVAFYPQIINTFHIASALGKPFAADPAFPNTSAPAGSVPVLHSFRVYDLRHRRERDYLAGDGSAKNSCVSKDAPGDVDLSRFDGRVSDGKRKPVLMCFLCKLSFGFARSFVSHAVLDHRMVLNEQEQKLLAHKHVSAIIQGIGKDQEPLVSFLEPKRPAPGYPCFPAPGPPGPDPAFRGLWAALRVENGEALQAGLAFLQGGPGPSPPSPPEPGRGPGPLAGLPNGGCPVKSEPADEEDGDGDFNGRPGPADDGPGAAPQHGPPPGGGTAPVPPGPADGSPGSGVECPKCDTVLGSSRSLGGHMTMMHSRNSCKTLKCPKCNWHYKYQQTLEAHMKEKHPEPGGSCAYCKSGQAHPRLARGESYTCGYKPFRCGVCNYSTTTKGNLSIHMQSDKHLNNVQNLQGGGPAGGGEPPFAPAPPAAAPAAPALPGRGAPSPARPKQKATWRCEVCDYETNVARNLRIHMTSEKHMHNVLLLQQNVKQLQHDLHLGLAPAEAELYQYYVAQNLGLTGLKLDGTADPPLLVSPFQLDAAALAPGLVAGDLPSELRLAGAQLVGEDLALLPGAAGDPALKIFQCAVCDRFSSDSLEALSVHVGSERALPEEEWRAVVGDLYLCRLCNYNTQLKANFQLHCKTDKHVQKYQLVAHIKEGGRGNEWRLKCLAVGNPVHLKCNACDHYANSVDKLHLHTANHRHEAALRLYKHLQKHEGAVSPDSCYYYCALCDYSTKGKLSLVQHVHSVRHHQTEGLRRLHLHQQGLPPEDEENLSEIFFVRDCPPETLEEPGEEPDATVKADEDGALGDQDDRQAKKAGRDAGRGTPEKAIKVTVGVGTKTLLPPEEEEDGPAKRPGSAEDRKFCPEQFYQCPYCNYNSRDPSRIQVHVLSQHSMQPVICCPLCQDVLSSKMHLQLHLTHLHSVAPDCVEKLLLSVPVPDALVPPTLLLPTSAADKSEHETPASLAAEGVGRRPGDDGPTGDPGVPGLEASKTGLEIKSEEEPPPPRPPEESDAPEWSRTGDGGPDAALPGPDPPAERERRRPPPGADRPGAGSRCGPRGLAFKTPQLPGQQRHQALRAAATCGLCPRSFRSPPALRRHLEAAHPELGEPELRQLCAALPGDLGWPDAAPDEPARDPEAAEEAEEAGGAEGGPPAEEPGVEPKRTLPFRKGPNVTVEKFLDPSRPYKCTVCKESFTQKNILLVHYNSVSHLHKLKRVLREASGSPGPADGPAGAADHKPYKCGVCSVAYSQASTLEIHLRSVLHQTKARAARLDGSPGLPADGPTKDPPPSDAKEFHKKQTPDLPAGPPPPAPAQLQAQLQHEFQQQQAAAAAATAFFPPQFLHPAFLPHFPVTPEALLQFQQPQFLFPFYLPGADFGLGPDLGPPGASPCALPGPAGSPFEDLKQQLQGQHRGGHSQLQIPPPEPGGAADRPSGRDPPGRREAAEAPEPPGREPTGEVEGLREGKRPRAGEAGVPPPRIASGARANAAKALLENFGFELVIQYNENRQKAQKRGRPAGAEGEGPAKLECGACAKLFSNALILKSHQEHVHGQLLPHGALEKFARRYREAYDKQYPISPPSPEPPAAPRPAAAASPAPPPAAPLPVTLDLPLFPPLMMPSVQHPALAPQLALQLTPVDALAADLSRLCQQQLGLDPVALRHAAQFKRPRTRITDDQLKVLRAYFDINNSPGEEQVQEMAGKSGLSQKVIKHWFRNTLFKERQRNKDSPYNFSNPPVAALDEPQPDPPPAPPDPSKADPAAFGKRSSRTRFTDYQLRVLQDFFDTNAYPKDDEIEQLSTVLNLPTRVIVVWFQNARQKARKTYENQAEAKDSEKRELTNERYVRTANLQYQCKKCGGVFPRIFDLITHQKKHCYKDEDDEAPDESPADEPPEAAATPPARSPEPEPTRTPPPPADGPGRTAAPPPPPPPPLSLAPLPPTLPPPLLQYQCDQCRVALPSLRLWQEHQHVHFLAAQNQFLHSPFLERPVDLPYVIFDPGNPLLASPLAPPPPPAGTPPAGPPKRKPEERDDAAAAGSGAGGGVGEDQHRDKRLRTTITPEQLEVLYEKYLLDSNPTRKMLDHIAREVGLKKRVVQVWFQNTRARERKGQFRALGPAQAHRRCPFCRALFKAKSALESHVRSRHWSEGRRAGSGLPPSPVPAPDDGPDGVPRQYVFFDCPALALAKADPAGQGRPAPARSPRGRPGPAGDDQGRAEPDETSSVNTAVSDAAAAEEPEAGPGPAPRSSPRGGGGGGGDPDTGPFPADDPDDGADRSESSSAADPGSPAPPGSGPPFRARGGERPGHKRFRTQMSNLQLKVLKACFGDYRTPTMQECELLGAEIGLPKRVVQVWFQNARAKEKKFKVNAGKAPQAGSDGGARPDCGLCGVKYSARLSVRDHVFSRQHIAKVRETVGSQLDRERDYLAPTTVRQLMAQQELDRIKKAADALALSGPLPPGPGDAGPGATSLLGLGGLPTTYPALPALPAGLLPGMNGPSPLPGFPPGPNALSSPSPGLLGFPVSTASSPAPSSGPAKPGPQTPPPPPGPGPPDREPDKKPPRPGKVRKVKEEEPDAPHPEKPPRREEKMAPGPGGLGPGGLGPGGENSRLPAPQGPDGPALLGGQFLPYFLPGFASYLAPQLPGAGPGGFLPPACGLEGLFPYGPVGSSPPPPPPPPDPPAPQPRAAPAKPPAPDGAKGDPPAAAPVKYEFICRKCRMMFAAEEPALTHQKSFCYFDQPLINPRETVLRVPAGGPPGGPCDAAPGARDHPPPQLRAGAHKEKTIKQAMRNAKEHIRLLPHSVRSPSPHATSTSPSAAPHNGPYPPPSSFSIKSWPNLLFPASTRKAAPPPPPSPPSTVTSSSGNSSGMPPSLPTESCSDESDSELSQKLEDLDHSLEVKAQSASGLDGNFGSLRMDLFGV